ncbi:MAG: ABC transporter permease subunit [Planktomarina sp.]
MIRKRIIGLPYLWLLLLFLLPFGIVFKISLSDFALSIPPYNPKFDITAGWEALRENFAMLDGENYRWLLGDDLYFKAYLSSLQIAFVATILTLIVGYPMAYAMASAPRGWRPFLMMLVILPFWSSFLIRIYAWIGILSNEGFLNMVLGWMGLPGVQVINTNIAVYIGVVYAYLPFMILPIYASLDRMNPALIEAAQDLGCTRTQAFWRITVPLSRPGIIAGCFLVFIPVVGEFIIPSLLGGSNTLMIGKVLYEEFFNNRDWPVASAVAVVLLLVLIIPIMFFQRHQERQ